MSRNSQSPGGYWCVCWGGRCFTARSRCEPALANQAVMMTHRVLAFANAVHSRPWLHLRLQDPWSTSLGGLPPNPIKVASGLGVGAVAQLPPPTSSNREADSVASAQMKHISDRKVFTLQTRQHKSYKRQDCIVAHQRSGDWRT